MMIHRKEILEKAIKASSVIGNESEYTPKTNLACLARLWSYYLSPYDCDMFIEEHDAAIMMCLLKISQIGSWEKRTRIEDYVDLATYAAIAGELASIKSEERGESRAVCSV